MFTRVHVPQRHVLDVLLDPTPTNLEQGCACVLFKTRVPEFDNPMLRRATGPHGGCGYLDIHETSPLYLALQERPSGVGLQGPDFGQRAEISLFEHMTCDEGRFIRVGIDSFLSSLVPACEFLDRIRDLQTSIMRWADTPLVA